MKRRSSFLRGARQESLCKNTVLLKRPLVHFHVLHACSVSLGTNACFWTGFTSGFHCYATTNGSLRIVPPHLRETPKPKGARRVTVTRDAWDLDAVVGAEDWEEQNQSRIGGNQWPSRGRVDGVRR